MAEPVAPVAPEPHHRRPFLARRAAIATPHELASVVGLEMLARDGSAVDAMVAANAALGVVYPHMSGAGGDAFWLIHDAATGRQHVLNASGRAAAAATREAYAAGGAREIAPRGPRAALTVPGAVDGWAQAHARFGRLPFADCLRAAIGLARDGFPVADSPARYAAEHRDLLAATPETAAAYLRPDGTPPRPAPTGSSRPACAIAAGPPSRRRRTRRASPACRSSGCSTTSTSPRSRTIRPHTSTRSCARPRSPSRIATATSPTPTSATSRSTGCWTRRTSPSARRGAPAR